MSLSALYDDLLKDFKDQKEMIYKQIELFDPLGTRLRQPAAVRLVSKTALIGTEILCYLLVLCTIALGVFLQKIYPFYLLAEIRNDASYAKLGWQNVEYFNLSIYGFLAVITVLFYIIARFVRQVRLKNDILHFAGKQMKELVAQHLKRKASIEIIEQRHFIELPPLPHEVGISVNDVPNPGYGN